MSLTMENRSPLAPTKGKDVMASRGNVDLYAFGGTPSGLSPKFNNNSQDQFVFYEPQAKSDYEAVFIDPEPDRTVFDDLDEGENIDRVADVKDTRSMEICTFNGYDAGAENKSDKVIDGKRDVKEKLNQCEVDWNKHQARATEYLEQAAKNLGYDPADVVGQFAPKDTTTKVGAAVSAGFNAAATGGGSLALQAAGYAGQTASIARSVNEERKDLTPDQKRALIEEVVKIAQAAAPPDTRASSVASSKPSGETPDQVAKNLAKLSCAKMEKLLTQKVDQQPEYQALQKVDIGLNKAMCSQDFYANNLHKTGDVLGNIYALAGAKDGAAQAILDRSMVVAAPVSREFDSCHAQLCGGSLVGISAMKLTGQFDLKSVLKVVDSMKFGEQFAAAQSVIYNDAQNAIRRPPSSGFG